MNFLPANDIREEAICMIGLLVKGLGKHSLSDRLPNLLASVTPQELNYLREVYAEEVDDYCRFLLEEPGVEAIEAEIQRHEIFIIALVWDRALRIKYVIESGVIDAYPVVASPDEVSARDVVIENMLMGSGHVA